MTAGGVQEQRLQKQMGCMAGFFQIFDRHQHLTGKHLCPSSPVAKPRPGSATNAVPPDVLQQFEKHPELRPITFPDRSMPSEPRSPAPEPSTPIGSAPKSPLTLPVFDFKEGTRSPWKFSKEAPRLSLDSRAVVDAKGSLKPREIHTNAGYFAGNRCHEARDGIDDAEKQRSSPSVIARLMGLEPSPESEPEPVKKTELRRCASESRVSKDLLQYGCVDEINFQLKQNQETNSQSNISSFSREKGERADKKVNCRSSNSKESIARTAKAEQFRATRQGIGSRKYFYNSADFFREPKQTVSIYGEIEKRLKLRGIAEPSKDLETLKQILDALQLKGLLHSKKSSKQPNNRNFVYEEFPIVVMRPSKYPVPARRLGNDSPPPMYTSRFGSRKLNPAGESPSRIRSSISPTSSEVSAKSPSRRKTLGVESPRRGSSFSEQRRVSPVKSPKVPSRVTGLDQTATRSPRIRKTTTEISQKVEKEFVIVPAEDELSCASSSSVSTNSQIDTERWKTHEGKSLLERCDKLLQSIAEITTPDLQPSPVSVLDASFYKEDESPSPIMKRRIDFKEQLVESEEDVWSPETASEDKFGSDFLYVSDVLRASNVSCEDTDLFLLLEKQQYLRGKDTSQASRLERRLIFDTINEILYQKRQLPPWKMSSGMEVEQDSLRQVWSEFEKIRERDTSEDLFLVICSVLRKDLAGDAINSWEDCSVEMSEAVLCIERLIFKDLIDETIQHLAALPGKCCSTKVAMLRRRLVF